MTLLDDAPATEQSEFSRALREELLARATELQETIAGYRDEIEQFTRAREALIAEAEDELDRVRGGARELDPNPPRRGRPPKDPGA